MLVEQTHTFLSQVLRNVEGGGWAPAPMQRPYVWGPDDVEALCLSVLRDYPIGGFLAWRPDDPTRVSAPVSRLGPIVPEGDPHTFILDGHNRLATMAWMAFPIASVDDPSPAERETWMSGRRLVLDVEQDRIRFVSPDDLPRMLWIGADALVTSSMLPVMRHLTAMEKAGHASADVDLIARAHDKAAHAFLSAKTAMVTLDRATPEEAKEAFLCICRTGVPMSAEDFDRAISREGPEPTFG